MVEPYACSSLAIYVSCEEKQLENIHNHFPQRVVVYKGGGEKSGFSTYISLYLANDTKYGHSYHGV